MTGARRITDIDIRGTVYPDVAAAAAACGVHPHTVRTARRLGTLHRVGCGRPGVEPYPVRIGGQDFASVEDAAWQLGINKATIYAAIADGDPDRVVRAPRWNPARAQPFTVGGLTWPSMRAASQAMGFKNPEYVAGVVKRGSRRGWERILAAAMRIEAGRVRAPP